MFPIFFISLLLVQPSLGAERPFTSSPKVSRFEQLSQLVKEKDIRTIGDLLGALPGTLFEDLLKNFVLMHHSRSTQAGSFKNPRVLAHTDDASFIMAFNGDPGQTGFDSLEIVEFDFKTNQFSFHEIGFDEITLKPPRIVAKPMRCFGCHFADRDDPSLLRTNWDSYPHWPGAYGSDDDFRDHPGLSQNVREQKEYRAFVASAKEHPRYRHLKLNPYYDQDVPLEENMRVTSRNAPNTFFGMQLAELNRKRVVKLILDKVGRTPLRLAFYLADSNNLLPSGEFRTKEVENKLYSDRIQSGGPWIEGLPNSVVLELSRKYEGSEMERERLTYIKQLADKLSVDLNLLLKDPLLQKLPKSLRDYTVLADLSYKLYFLRKYNYEVEITGHRETMESAGVKIHEAIQSHRIQEGVVGRDSLATVGYLLETFYGVKPEFLSFNIAHSFYGEAENGFNLSNRHYFADRGTTGALADLLTGEESNRFPFARSPLVGKSEKLTLRWWKLAGRKQMERESQKRNEAIRADCGRFLRKVFELSDMPAKR